MLRRIVHAPRVWKMLIVLAFDAALIPIALVLALMVRLGSAWPAEMLERSAPLFVVMMLAGLGIALLLRIPQIRHSSFDLNAITRIGLFAAALAVLGTLANAVLGLGAPRTVPIIFGPIFFCLSGAGKLAGHALLVWLLSLGI